MIHNKHHHDLHPRSTIILASAILIGASLPTAMQANAETQLTLLHSFTQETKIKGPFCPHGGLLYGVADKGGAANAGYIGRLDPSTASWVPVYEFSTETKVKGGLVPVENRLWFVCEKVALPGMDTSAHSTRQPTQSPSLPTSRPRQRPKPRPYPWTGKGGIS